MPIVIVAGIPERLIRRAKPSVAQIATGGVWEIKFFPSPSNDPEIRPDQVPPLLDLAATLDSPHIVGFQGTNNRTAIARQIRQHFRFRWGEAATLKTLGAGPDQFRVEVEAMLEEEIRWREHVMPRDKSSPLILPASLFSRLQKHEDVWGQSEMYGREIVHFEQLAKKIRHFQREHTKVYPTGASFMVDRSGLVWKDAGPYHAKTPPLRRWKYSCLMVDKFHYDVEHYKGNAFKITDSANVEISKKANEHANIDCHGYKSH